MEQRGAEPTARKRKADLTGKGAAYRAAVAAEKLRQDRLGVGSVPAAAHGRRLQACQPRELPYRRLLLPIRHPGQRRGAAQQRSRFGMPLQTKQRLGNRDKHPPKVLRGRHVFRWRRHFRQNILADPAGSSAPIGAAAGGHAPGHLLRRQQIVHKGGVDRCVSLVLIGPLGLAAQVVIERAFQIVSLPICLPPALVDGSGQTERLLIVGGLEIGDPAQNR